LEASRESEEPIGGLDQESIILFITEYLAIEASSERIGWITASGNAL